MADANYEADQEFLQKKINGRIQAFPLPRKMRFVEWRWLGVVVRYYYR